MEQGVIFRGQKMTSQFLEVLRQLKMGTWWDSKDVS